MLSKEKISNELKVIARNKGLVGEAVNLMIDQLTYSLFHEQVELNNAVQESNLSTAYLINSKIRNCMNVMYPVYRGKNARIKLHVLNEDPKSYKKFDVIYESNSFKIYAEVPEMIQQSVVGVNDITAGIKTIRGILSKEGLIEQEYTITANNKFYLDLRMNYNVVSDVSEDIEVIIDGKSYPTTRNFHDHIKAQVPYVDYDTFQMITFERGVRKVRYFVVKSNKWEEYCEGFIDADTKSKLNLRGTIERRSDLPNLTTLDLDPIFILTLPDFGIRLYKRGFFTENTKVKVRALKYTKLSDINPDEFSRIVIPGTRLVVEEGDNPRSAKLNINNLVSYLEDEVVEVGSDEKTYLDSGAVEEVPREDGRSVLYNANFHERLQSQILSRSDVNILFSEYFIDKVRSAISWHSIEDNQLYIFYIPKSDRNTITESEVKEYKAKYASHFISMNINVIKAVKNTVTVHIDSVNDDSSKEISSEVAKVFEKYEYILHDQITEFRPELMFNQKQIHSELSRINGVSYIDDFHIVRQEFDANATNDSSNEEFVKDGVDIWKNIRYYAHLSNSNGTITHVKDNTPVPLKVPTYCVVRFELNQKTIHETLSK